jgi:hypothetical protein
MRNRRPILAQTVKLMAALVGTGRAPGRRLPPNLGEVAMDRWTVLSVWIAGLAAGVASWWALLAWLGPGVLLAAIAVAAAVAVGVPEPRGAAPRLPLRPGRGSAGAD